MASSQIDTAAPAPLRLPAILQNPQNRIARQVESHNAQQREKLAARRERELPSTSQVSSKRVGKNVIRRKDNATFASNPHISPPTRSDYAPAVPLQFNPFRPAFPPSTLPRSIPIPPAVLPDKDPFSTSSQQGSFSTSLKGTRHMLRKRGRRSEVVVSKVEAEIRSWVGGSDWAFGSAQEQGDGWKIIDGNLVEVPEVAEEKEGESSGSMSTSLGNPNRRMPERHHIKSPLPPLPIKDDLIPSILELSRSPAHMTWAVPDSFDRLVVHLVARYYELLSWSEDHRTVSGQDVRLTHIIIPHISRPPAIPITHNLLTPDNSDLSAPSGSDLDSNPNMYSESDSATETETEVSSEIGHSLDMAEEQQILSMTSELERIASIGSSVYASSEGGTGAESEYGVLGDSVELPLRPAGLGTDWLKVNDEDETRAGKSNGFKKGVGNGRTGTVPLRQGRAWEDRPTFFEYLYGS